MPDLQDLLFPGIVTIPQYNIDVSMLEAALSEKTKAVMLAHTLGNPFDLQAVKEFCKKHDLWLVEDNCDALGTRYTIDGEVSAHVLMSGTPAEVFARAEELLSAGLDVPQVTRIAMRLREQGLAIDPAVYTVEALERELLALRRGRCAVCWWRGGERRSPPRRRRCRSRCR